MAETPEERLMERVQEGRLKWRKHIEYILSSLGYVVGLFNVWRFPYVCYNNGGAAFLLPYVIMMIIVGIPLYLMEAAVGQFPSFGPVLAFGCVPIGGGIGLSQVILSFVICTYYAVILVWTLIYFYFGMSLHEVPWRNCTNHWGQDEETCYVANVTTGPDIFNYAEFHPPFCNASSNGSDCKNYETAAVQFFYRYVLDMKPETTFENIAPIIPAWALLLLLVWVITYLCIARGIQTSGKLEYFGAVFPYLVLGYFCIVGFSLDGASEGLLYLFRNIDAITDPNVWQAAVTQLLLSLSIGLGGVVMYASFNEFQNKLFRDAVIIIILDFVTSMLATIAIFCVIGFYSKYLGVAFEDTYRHGVNVLFLAMPDVIVTTPFPKIAILILFLMIFLIGIDSQFVLVETMVVTVEELWPVTRRFRNTIGLVICTCSMLIGLVYVTRGGMLVLSMVDTFIEIAVTWVVFWEIILVVFFYGLNRHADDLYYMTSFELNWGFRICLSIIAPIVLLVMFIFGLMNYDPLKEEDGFEMWANYVGFGICAVIFLVIPIYLICVIIKFAKRRMLKKAFCPTEEWGPSDANYKTYHSEWVNDRDYHSNPIKQIFKKQDFPKVPPLKEIH